jgi:hypothetical protein
MSCQIPVLNKIPPAPWYCSICINQPKSASTITSSSVLSGSQYSHAMQSHLSLNTASSTPITNTVGTGFDNPLQMPNETYQESTTTTPAASQSAWVTIMNSDTPPLSDEAGTSPVDNRFVDNQMPRLTNSTLQTDSIIKKPIKIKLGKRHLSNLWQSVDESDSVKKDEDSPSSPRKCRSANDEALDNTNIRVKASPISSIKNILANFQFQGEDNKM